VTDFVTPCLTMPLDQTEAQVRERRARVAAAAIRQASGATLDEHCHHPAEERSADGTRCLCCGLLTVQP
jgi:hypothetical protein